MKKDGPINEADELYVQALLLAKVIERILNKKADIDLSAASVLERKPITEFVRRMRVSGLTKFEEKTYISIVNFYKTNEDLKSHKAIGALIIYVPESYVVRLFRDLGYPVIDEDDAGALLDACGTFCNLVAGNFKSGLLQLDYPALEMSHFVSYQNEVADGVAYDPTQKELYQISFEIKDKRRMVADLTMGPLEKTKQTKHKG